MKYETVEEHKDAPQMRHWVEVRVEDQRVISQVVCEDPQRCQERWNANLSTDSGCLIVDSWAEQGEDLLEVGPDAFVDNRGPLIGRLEIGYRWEGGEDPELYVIPQASAEADRKAMADLADAAVDVLWQGSLGGPTMPSHRECVDVAVRALWEAGYRRYGATPQAPSTITEARQVDDGICRRTDLGSLTVDKVCPGCGHWPLAHSIANRKVPNDECQICLIISLANRLPNRAES